MWGKDYNNLLFCDYDEYCKQVLKKRFPGATIYGDIRTVANTTGDRRTGGGTTATLEERYAEEPRNARELAGRLERPYSNTTTDTGSEEQRGLSSSEWQAVPQIGQSVDLLTGGFPCQPFSQAGRRKGTDDNRYLWPEMLRVIRAFKPTWVIAENVRGLLTIQQGVVFEQVCLDLEASGYEVQPLIIPAVAVNAPHRRDRVWFIAHRKEQGLQGSNTEGDTRTGGRNTEHVKRDVTDSINTGLEGEEASIKGWEEHIGQYGNGFWTGLESSSRSWNTHWSEIAAQFCQLDDELPSWMDRHIKNVINFEDYGTTLKNDIGKILPALQQEFSTEEVWEKLGGLYEVEQKEILLSFLCRIQEGFSGQDNLPQEGNEAQENPMRKLWEYSVARCSPHRREYQKQQADKLINLVPQMPLKLALRLAEDWDNLWLAYSSMTNRPVELDGFKLSKSRHRAEQLKAYGNAIVPAVAIEIMKAIKQTKKN